MQVHLSYLIVHEADTDLINAFDFNMILTFLQYN